MADQPNSGGDGKEFSMEKRLILAFVLMGAVLFLSPYFLRTNAPVEPVSDEVAQEQDGQQPAASDEPAPPPGDSSAEQAAADTEILAEPLPDAVAADAEETITVDTDVYRITFSNRGAVVKSWILKQYSNTDGEPLELINTSDAASVGYPFSLIFQEGEPALDPNSGLYVVERSDDGLGVEFTLSNGVTYYHKSFHFQADQYLSEVTSEATHNGRRLPHLLAWRGGFGDRTVQNAITTQHTLFYNVADSKLERQDSKKGKDGPVTFSGDYSFAGIEDAYFAAVALPGNGSFQLRVYTDNFAFGESDSQPHAGIAIGGEGVNEFPIYVGPKDLDLLEAVDPRLRQLVDLGWLSFLAKPLLLGLKWVHDNWVHNYGWAIVILTILINTLLMPLKFSSMKSMKKMSVLQPEVKKIQDKYKGMSMRDPRRQGQNEELMKLYQKHNVNPLGGCMPMAMQIPFFFAFYQVLRVAIELRGAEWLWVTDLSQPETLPIRILPITMVASQFAMQRMTPTTAANPSQQRVMMFMPLMMGFIFYKVSSGLVLYWLTSNLVGVGQQLLINKFGGDAPKPPAEETLKQPATAKRKGRKK